MLRRVDTMSVTDGRHVAGLAAAALLIGVGSALAQSVPPAPSTSSPIQFGSLSLRPSIFLRDVGIDDNVFNDALQPRQDFTYTVIPRLQAELPVGSVRLVGASSLGFVYFQRYKDQQALNGFVQGWLEAEDSARVRPFASGSFTRSRERVGEDIDTRALRIVTNTTAGLDVRTTAITALTAWVRREQTGYGEGELFRGVGLAQQLNHTRDSVAAGVKLTLTPFTTVVVAAEVQQARFERESLRDARSLRIGPLVRFGTGAVITGEASAAFREFRPLDARLPRYRGFVGSGEIGFSVLNQTSFGLSANRDVSYSYDAAEPYYLESGGRFTVSQRLVGPLELIALGGRQQLRYQDFGAASFDGRSENVTSIGGGLGIRLGEQMRFTLTYDRSRRTSTGPLPRTYERNRVMGSVDYAL